MFKYAIILLLGSAMSSFAMDNYDNADLKPTFSFESVCEISILDREKAILSPDELIVRLVQNKKPFRGLIPKQRHREIKSFNAHYGSQF